jgi:RES domain-containing protein
MARHEMTALARAHVRETTHRLIASRYPPIGVFDDLTTDKNELAVAYLLESVTNDRVAILARRLPLLPESEIVQGPGATLVMAAFLHADESGGRFTDGRLGAWYAALDLATAIAETVHHSTRRLKLSDGAFPSSIRMQQLVTNVDCPLVDIRGQQESRPELYDPDDYSASQTFGVGLRWPQSGVGENGIVYDSVRHAEGTNVCVYRPSLIQLPVNQADHYEYRWDAAGAVTILKLSNIGRQ